MSFGLRPRSRHILGDFWSKMRRAMPLDCALDWWKEILKPFETELFHFPGTVYLYEGKNPHSHLHLAVWASPKSVKQPGGVSALLLP